MNYLRRTGLLIPLCILSGAILFGIVLFAFLYALLTRNTYPSSESLADFVNTISTRSVNSPGESVQSDTTLEFGDQVQYLTSTNFEINSHNVTNSSTIVPSFSHTPSLTFTPTQTFTPTMISADDSGVYVFPTSPSDKTATSTMAFDLIDHAASKTPTTHYVGTTPSKTYKPTTTLQRTSTPTQTSTPTVTGTLTITNTYDGTLTATGTLTLTETYEELPTITETPVVEGTLTPEISLTFSPTPSVTEYALTPTDTPTTTDTPGIEPTFTETLEFPATTENTPTEEIQPTLDVSGSVTVSPTIDQTLTPVATYEGSPLFGGTLDPSITSTITPTLDGVTTTVVFQDIVGNTDEELIAEINQNSQGLDLGKFGFLQNQKKNKPSLVTVYDPTELTNESWQTKIISICDWSITRKIGFALVFNKDQEIKRDRQSKFRGGCCC